MTDHTEVDDATAPIVFGNPEGDDESGDAAGTDRTLPGPAGLGVGR